MKKFLAVATVFGLWLGATAPAQAGCRWVQDCTSGICKQVQLCDSVTDLSQPRPPAITPIAPPSIRPLPQQTLPPLGTKSCQMRNICDSSGKCHWQNVCE